MGKSQLFDLENHLVFYGAYHSNPVNNFLHTITVWPMFFGFLVLFYFIPPVFDVSGKIPVFLSGLFGPAPALNFGFLFAMIHALIYVSFDKKAGFLAAVICFACWIGACGVASRLGFSLAWKVVLGFQLSCFGTQALGHAIWEKRAPSDNLIQALAMAPFCVLLQVLDTLFGYEPYPGFHASVKAKTEVEIKNCQDRMLKKIS